MNLKTKAIGCVKFKVKHYWCKDFEEQIEVGIVTNSYTKNNEPYIEFYTTMGNTINIPLKNISSFTSTRISEELRELLKEYYKEYCSYTKEREKLLLLEKELNKKNQYLKQYSSKLLVAQGILTPNEFINALTEKLNLTNSDWAVDFNPGCCILYEDNNETLYFYREKEVLENYQARYSSLVYEEYDRTYHMCKDYQTKDEFKRYKNRYERELFPNLPIKSICYLSNKDGLYFKSFQEYKIGKKHLNLKLVEEIAKDLISKK